MFCAEVLQVRRKEIQNRRAGRSPGIAEFRIRVAPGAPGAPLLPCPTVPRVLSFYPLSKASTNS